MLLPRSLRGRGPVLLYCALCLAASHPEGSEANDGPLIEMARSARDLALRRMLEKQKTDGSWNEPIDWYAFPSALYIITTRTTGLIRHTGFAEEETQLLRHITSQANPDGGFYRYTGSPSCKNTTRIVLLAIRLALGDIEPRERPAAWYRLNQQVNGDLEWRLRRTIDKAERYLRHGESRSSSFEADHKVWLTVLEPQVRLGARTAPYPVFSPRLAAATFSPVARRTVTPHVSYFVRRTLPAISVMYHRGRERCFPWRVVDRGLGWCPWYERLREAPVEKLITIMREDQDECGGWFFNPPCTMVNMIALVESGVPAADPAIRRAHEYVRRRITPDGRGGAFLNATDADMWNTAHGLMSYLAIPPHAATDAPARSAIDFILGEQCDNGGFAFARGAGKDADNDSTGFLLGPLSLALESAEGDLRTRLARATRAASAFLLGRQDRRGGFSCWDPTLARPAAAPAGYLRERLFEAAGPDITARAVYGLARSGLTPQDEPARKSLRFFLRTRHRNGAWWGRWWAGYLSGTGFVLKTYGALGIRCDTGLEDGDRLLAASCRAMKEGVKFVLEHQNPDGGWGETVRADEDIRYAGRGASTPLRTAFMISALLQAGHPAADPAVRQGIRYLLDTMSADGRWTDDQSTFTLFPNAQYYTYPFLTYFLPLECLTEYLQAVGAGKGEHSSRAPANK